MQTPFIIVIGGPNGVGKSTFAMEYLRLLPERIEYIDPDMVALGLNTHVEEHRNIAAGRLVLARFDALVQQRRSFAIESTLSGVTLARRLQCARDAGYHIAIRLLVISDVKETMFRVRQRVSSGGHNVPDEVQQRRFQRCYENFRDVYRDICHEWSTHDVSERWR